MWQECDPINIDPSGVAAGGITALPFFHTVKPAFNGCSFPLPATMKERELPLFHEVFNVYLPELLQRWGVADRHVEWLSMLAGISVAAVLLLALAHLLSWVFNLALRRIAVTTVGRFDDHLVERRLPGYLARVIPLALGYNLIPAAFQAFPRMVRPVEHLFNIFFIVLIIRIVRAVLQAGRDTLQVQDTYRGKPLGSYVQVLSLVLYIFGGLAIFSQLTGRSIGTFLLSMGAASAVLLLIFKDTILGFVASIQISANNMVHIGDWIAMPKYGADGDVIEINLTTVKVLNFDKTVTTIPTYALISDSFQNYRSMQQGGGRRIKRSIRIKMSSIRYLAPEELQDLKRIEILAGYIAERHQEIEAFNAKHEVDKSLLLNGRNLTNVGLFRKYMELYILDRPEVRKDMTRMVRQLAPDEFGLPLELYCFSSDVNFVGYEGVQSDIFDHLIAAAPTFGLTVFEKPAADDVRFLARAFNPPAP